MESQVLDKLHRLLSRSRFVVAAAAKLQNQLSAIIRYSIASDFRPWKNGEAWLLSLVGPRTRTFVDVGANVGDWTALLLERAPGDIAGVLVEPAPSAVDRLRERFASDPRLRILAAAAGASSGTAEFYDLGAASEHSSVVPRESATVRSVPIVTVAEIATWPRLDLLKVDTEGFDWKVLEGCGELLREARIGVVQFEYGDGWAGAGSTLAYALERLRAYGYEVFRLKPSALERFRYEQFREYFGYSNYVAVAPWRMDEVRSVIRD